MRDDELRLKDERLRVGSTLEEVRQARAWLAARLSAAGRDSEFSAEVLLAVGEALTNVVRHAYHGQPGHPIDLGLHCGPSSVQVTLEDEAPYFAAADSERPPDPERLAEGGYGLFLMRTLMDEVRREPRPGGGNVLRLSKSWSGAERKAS